MSLTLNVAEDLNNWGDAETHWAGIPVSVADDAANLADALEQESTERLQISDSFLLKADVLFNFLRALAEADSMNNWSDALTTQIEGEIGTSLGDDLDAWADALNLFVTQNLQVADMNASMEDFIRLVVSLRLILADSMTLSDSHTLQLAASDQTLSIADTAEFLLDSLTQVLVLLKNFEDSMLQSDALVVETAVGLSVSIGDSMNNWNDTVSTSVLIRSSLALKEGMTSYLRRYLND